MLRCPGEQLGVRSRRLTRREATMGLDARVRCRCFEDGRLKPGPVPVTDLYIDEDGYLASRTLDTASIRYDWRRYHARYGKLDEEFTLWLEDCCEHENGEYCSEWIGTWGMYGVFQDVVEEAGGKEVLPLLGHMLPTANGGQYPVEKTEAHWSRSNSSFGSHAMNVHVAWLAPCGGYCSHPWKPAIPYYGAES